MYASVTDYLDEAAEKYCDKVAFVDANVKYTYAELKKRSIGLTRLLSNVDNSAIAIYLDKSIYTIISMLGIAYTSNFYCVMDSKISMERIERQLDFLEPAIVITDNNHLPSISSLLNSNTTVILIEDVLDENDECFFEKNENLNSDRSLYVMFTSGSEGEPKAVETSHYAVLEYVKAATIAYSIDEKAVFGNQYPFYFVGAVEDIFLTLKNCATMYIIPEIYFFTPYKVAEYIHNNSINTIIWVPSAMKLIAQTNAWDFADMTCLRKIIFGGEALQLEIYKQWKSHFPAAVFINGYGSTEITAGGCFFVVDESKCKNEVIPIGSGYPNVNTYVLNENKQIIDEGVGELYIESTSLAKGYYKNKGLTEELFVAIRDPRGDYCRTYKTGDLVEIDHGCIFYVGRKDNQVKKNGYRIELTEIENAVEGIEGVDDSTCIFYDNKIIILYSGHIESGIVASGIKDILPNYMMPDDIVYIESIIYNQNGKKDRKKMMALYGEQIDVEKRN